MKRRLFILGGILAAAATIVGGGVIGYVVRTEKAQSKRNAKLADYKKPAENTAKTLVVCFSRSGNTELMAHEIARTYSADIVRLEAEDYRLGLMGWINAMKDARGENAVITPETVDLSAYDRVFIGSPIWLYSPAPPVWQFVAANDFAGKDVVLFNTFNSKFEPSFIDQFRANVEARGGKLSNHIWVNRGRMTDQIDAEPMLRQARLQIQRL